MYQAIFCLGYYELMRVGELAQGDHPVKAKNIHVARNKDKILIILYSSKTHTKGNYPQEIKISSNTKEKSTANRFFFPFATVRSFLAVRRQGYLSDDENFFIFQDGSPIKPNQTRSVLRTCIGRLNLDSKLYNF